MRGAVNQRQTDNRIWACGGMVDTLVLGTSAQAWEFESLHAQTEGYSLCYTLQFCVLSIF